MLSKGKTEEGGWMLNALKINPGLSLEKKKIIKQLTSKHLVIQDTKVTFDEYQP